jgi:actin-related protein
LGGKSSCIKYIIPPPPPPPKTKAQREAEEAAAEERKQRAEERRLEREEEERKRAEERKIKEEQERIAREERERQEEQRRLEEERLKAEKIRLAEEKKIREEEERRRYVEENTVTTHLYCPSTSKKRIGMYKYSEEPTYFYGSIINKVDNKYLMSEFYTSDQSRKSFKTDKSCKYWLEEVDATRCGGCGLPGYSQFGNKALFCEKIADTAHTFVFTQTIPKLKKYDQNILEFSHSYFIDRTTLISGKRNPCEVVTKEEFESKVMIPLKKDFDSVIAPFIQMKEILEQQPKIEKKI